MNKLTLAAIGAASVSAVQLQSGSQAAGLWDKVKNAVNNAVDDVSDAAQSVGDAVVDLGESIGDVATSVYEDAVDFGETAYDYGVIAYEDGLVVAYEAVEQEIEDGLPNVEEFFELMFVDFYCIEAGICDWAVGVWEDVEDTVEDVEEYVENAVDNVEEYVENAVDNVEESV